MASNTVRVSVEADTRKFEKGFDKAQAKAVGFGSAVGTLAGNVAFDLGQKALGAVTDFVGESADAFTRLEQSVGGTEAVFGSARGVIDDFAENSAEKIGLSEAAFREATTGIGGQLKRMTGDVEFAAEQSIFLTEVAGDLAATYGGTTAEAVQALGAAFRGEADPAERFNLDLKIGKQNAKAVELGLADTTSAVDDHARAQAVLALVTEQSADAQGQFARESETAEGRTQRLTAAIENQQAALGETAKEWELFWLQQKSNVAVGGAVVLNWFSAFGDDVTAAERDMRDFEIRTGESADTAAAAITIWKEFGSSMYDLIPAMNLSRDELGKLRRADEEWLISLGWTEEGIRKVNDIIDKELLKSMPKASTEAHLLALNTDEVTVSNEELAPTIEEIAAAEDKQAEATRNAISAMAEKRTALKEIHDPLFRMTRQLDDLATAEEEVAELEAAAKQDTPEYREAIFKRAEVIAGLEQTLVDLQELGINPTGAAAREMLEGLGVPNDVIDGVFAQFDELERNFENRRFRLTMTLPTFRYTDSGGVDQGTGVTISGARQHGGIDLAREGGKLVAVAEAGSDEATIPLNGEGARFMAATMTEALKQMNGSVGAGVTVLISGDVYGFDDFEEKVTEAIIRARRRAVNV